MTLTPEHTVKRFDDELEKLKLTIQRMGSLVEVALETAVQSMNERDRDKAEAVVAADPEIDRLELEVESIAVRLLALRQPMANDLREVVSALKLASDLERAGDHAANIARRAAAQTTLPLFPRIAGLPRMARLVQANLHEALEAYRTHDKEQAVGVWKRDEEIDLMYTGLFRELLTHMMEDPRNISGATNLLFIAKNLERVGDHATNLGEITYYLTTGERLEGGRPKGPGAAMIHAEPRA